ncbi:hypothetical protein Goklo_017901, partial [Gossypium klotzschianum]|nr:hypothetical protein [Gossypium klotzschianum]
KADKHETNEAGLTALEAAHQQNNIESISILRDCFSPRVSNFKYKLKKQIGKYVAKASSLIFDDVDNISSEDRSTLLIILGLLLTASFQVTLSPPGGVLQGENFSKSKGAYDANAPGKSVLGEDCTSNIACSFRIMLPSINKFHSANSFSSDYYLYSFDVIWSFVGVDGHH